MSWEERITITPGARGGKPCIKGTRITAYDILERLAGGMTEDPRRLPIAGARKYLSYRSLPCGSERRLVVSWRSATR